MTNFLNLPIQVATTDYGPEGAVTFPDGECPLYVCQHGRVFRKGQSYVRFDGSFVHTDCLDAIVQDLGKLDFLTMLASHVAKSPSNHNSGTIRQVITGLRRALGALQLERDQAVAEAYARGAAEAAQAIAEQGGRATLPIDIDSAIAASEDEGE